MKYKGWITCVWEWLQNSIKQGVADSHLEFLYLQAGRWEPNLKPLEKIWAYESILNNSHLRIGERVSIDVSGDRRVAPCSLCFLPFRPYLPLLRFCSPPYCWFTPSPVILPVPEMSKAQWVILQCTEQRVWACTSGLFSRFLKLGVLPWRFLASSFHITVKWTPRK